MNDHISAPLCYMPPVSVFRQWVLAATIDFQTNHRYAKMSFSNRCVIATSNGMLHLSIPILGGRGFRGNNSQVLVDNRQAWQQQHWRTIFSAYGRAPWFEHYGPGLDKLYQQSVDSLADWNLRCLQWVCDSLRIKFPEIKPPQVPPLEENQGKVCVNPRPSDFQSSDFKPFPAYIQVFQEKNGFLPNLSILDFVLCAGPNYVRDWIDNGSDNNNSA